MIFFCILQLLYYSTIHLYIKMNYLNKKNNNLRLC